MIFDYLSLKIFGFDRSFNLVKKKFLNFSQKFYLQVINKSKNHKNLNLPTLNKTTIPALPLTNLLQPFNLSVFLVSDFAPSGDFIPS